VRAEERAALRAILAQMPATQREVLDLRYGEDLSREEIAEVLGIEASVVKSRLYEGLQRLRSQARHLGPSEGL
jgi:RNA polymerase sigma-70 factor (ECF subfamily)